MISLPNLFRMESTGSNKLFMVVCLQKYHSRHESNMKVVKVLGEFFEQLTEVKKESVFFPAFIRKLDSRKYNLT